MELIFVLIGRDFLQDGRKATAFSQVCSALGVTFDLRSFGNEKKMKELTFQLDDLLECKELSRPEALPLRGRLGFADGFLHGRLGVLVFTRLVDHAYESTSSMDSSLLDLLSLMKDRLLRAKPK